MPREILSKAGPVAGNIVRGRRRSVLCERSVPLKRYKAREGYQTEQAVKLDRPQRKRVFYGQKEPLPAKKVLYGQKRLLDAAFLHGQQPRPRIKKRLYPFRSSRSGKAVSSFSEQHDRAGVRGDLRADGSLGGVEGVLGGDAALAAVAQALAQEVGEHLLVGTEFDGLVAVGLIV